MIQDGLDTVMETMEQQALEALDDATDLAIGKRRIIITWAVGAAWERFCREKSHIIMKAFRVVGMSLPVNGQNDAEIHIKGLSEIEVGDWRDGRQDTEIACDSDLEDMEIGEDKEDDEGWEYEHRD
ncbi:hypothetical protein HOY82DRAFT_543282 [Tuber indicum]|nr:hypothetical protein HOY82DRAFT_543282 [Tuber indicum]